MDPAADDRVIRVLRWAGTTRSVADAVIVMYEAGWLHDREFLDECAVASVQDPERVLEIDWFAVDAFIARHDPPLAPAVRALRKASALAPSGAARRRAHRRRR
jgi:hypothetical protein